MPSTSLCVKKEYYYSMGIQPYSSYGHTAVLFIWAYSPTLHMGIPPYSSYQLAHNNTQQQVQRKIVNRKTVNSSTVLVSGYEYERVEDVGHARCVVPAVKTPRDRPRPGFVSTALRGSAHEIYKGKGRGRGSFRTSYETVHKNST